MRLILTEDVPKLGQAGELVRVKRGYGRNYLIPQGKAQLATEGRVKEVEHQKRVVDEKVKKEVSGLEGVAQRMKGVVLTFEVQSNTEGKLFGSVTNQDLAAGLAEQGFEVDRRKIELGEPIKQVGEHQVNVRLHREVQVEISVSVTSSGIAPDEPEEEPSPAEAAMETRESRAHDDDEE